MTKLLKPLLIACVLNVIGSSAALAQAELTKDEVKEQVIEACQTEAKKRYGEDSVQYISSKTKWMKAMGGALVKMKVKPEGKRVTKYKCVLQQDQLVKFYKV
ncbi:hypothetical protein [Paraglaciecola arctica]|uniref:PepSY domain-containing protein n=1 Tax=Paraglaciecola arctica BSs20135 TaxID=493475 RepID=K6YUP6_9ALTE|nr:hypothetical protein [Paraglaciecola arctica]GAC20423.1 hypothetical protein GARC_3468 [Paraglaciecola arctica BSs20135]